MNSKDILQEPIWNNKYFRYKGKTLYFKSWINIGIRYVKDIFRDFSAILTSGPGSKKIGKIHEILVKLGNFDFVKI